MKKLFIPAVLVLLLSACGTTASSLKYAASTEKPIQVSKTAQPVTVGAFQDLRDGDKKWLGVIRGGFGNHLKTLEADRPVDGMVKQAFEDGLSARKVSVASGGNAQLTGKIIKLNADQMVRREGTAEVELAVIDLQGAKRLSKTYTHSRTEGSILSLQTGALASIDDLRDVLQRTLSELVDKALDDPELRSALNI